MTAVDRIREALEQKGCSPIQQGNAIRARCPAHDGGDRNLALYSRHEKAGLTCHSHQCEDVEILEALGLGVRDLFDNRQSVVYEYRATTGEVEALVARKPDPAKRKTKTFKQQVKVKGSRVLYNLDAVYEAVAAGETIYLVEGEEDVHTLERLGITATTARQGGGNAGKADFSPLMDASVVAVVDKDPTGDKWATAVAEQLEKVGAAVTLKMAAEGKDVTDHIDAGRTLDDLLDYAVDEPVRPRVWKASDLEKARPVDWLAYGRIPRAGTSLLVGEEGIGKSMLWVWLFAALTTGKGLEEWGIPAGDPQHCVAVVTEDDWSSTVRPRLEVAGADLDYVSVICEEKDGSGAPIFPRDLHLLGGLDPAPALIIVDAWVDTLPKEIDVKSPQGARQALRGWRDVAVKFNCATLLVTHTNRSSTGNARDKYGATSELRKAARSTLYAQPDPEDSNVMVCGPEKSNLARVGNASRFTITPVEMFEPTVFDDGTVGRLTYLGEHAMTARELVADTHQQQTSKDAPQKNEAVAWLEDHLDGRGLVPSGEVKAAAKNAGFSERTIQRAIKDGGFVSESFGFPRQTHWSSPASPASGATSSATSQGGGATGATGSDQGKRPTSDGATGAVPPVAPRQMYGATGGATEDPRPDCPTCQRAMGKAEAKQGQCFQCQRIAAFSAKQEEAA